MTQKRIVANHLLEWGAITSWEAFMYYGITRLASIIYRLKNDDGWSISSKDCTKKNRYGMTCVYTEYMLEKAGGSEK